jgi:hypothetical protein
MKKSKSFDEYIDKLIDDSNSNTQSAKVSERIKESSLCEISCLDVKSEITQSSKVEKKLNESKVDKFLMNYIVCFIIFFFACNSILVYFLIFQAV